jgi:hypothetical protein
MINRISRQSGASEELEEAEEAALNSWMSAATYRPANVDTGLPGTSVSADQWLPWTSAALTASKIMQTMSETMSKAMRMVMREQSSKETTIITKDSTQSHKRKHEEVEEEETDRQPQLPPLPGSGRRLDYVLPVTVTSLFEAVQHEYFSGLSAHFVYWHHKSCAKYIVQQLGNGPDDELR